MLKCLAVIVVVIAALEVPRWINRSKEELEKTSCTACAERIRHGLPTNELYDPKIAYSDRASLPMVAPEDVMKMVVAYAKQPKEPRGKSGDVMKSTAQVPC
jgi:hypothetical protein